MLFRSAGDVAGALKLLEEKNSLEQKLSKHYLVDKLPQDVR